MKKLFTLLLGICLFHTAYTQTPVGYTFNIDGNPIEGYYDPMIHEAGPTLNFTYTADDYERGYYYTLKGDKIGGLLKFHNRKVLFKTSTEDKKGLELDEDNCQSLVIGMDSFFVAEILIESATISDPRSPKFVQYLTKIGNVEVVKHYYMARTNQTGYITTFHVKRNGGRWKEAPKGKKAFKDFALGYFSDIPLVTNKIQADKFELENMMSLVKSAAYSKKYIAKEWIYFDKFWTEIPTPERMMYKAKVQHVDDSLWTLSYYQGKQKLYEVQYASLYPNRKQGYCYAYYPNGNIREKAIYNKDELRSKETFYEDGSLHHQYGFRDVTENYEDFKRLTYTKVIDAKGESLLNAMALGTETFTDSISGNTITNTYRNLKPVVSSVSTNGRTYYHITSNDFKFPKERIQTKLNDFIKGRYYYGAIEDNAQGLIMVLVSVNASGNVEEYKIINQLHPEIDKLIETFLYTTLSAKASNRVKMKKYSIDGKKVSYQMLLPIRFSVNRFYRTPSHYQYDWQLHQMMFHNQQQMMMQQQINNIQVPSFPRF